MVNAQLLEYVRRELAQGLSKEAIERNLTVSGGWSIADVSEAFAAVGANQPAPVPPVPQVPQVPPVVSFKMPSMMARAPSVSEPRYAGFWVRLVAVMVDSCILMLPAIALELYLFPPTAVPASSPQPVNIMLVLTALGIVWVYYTLMTYAAGATLGKLLVGIRVKSENLNKLSFMRVLLRETIGKLISQIILYIGFILVAFTHKKRGLHDMIAGSVVVYKDPDRSHVFGITMGVIIAVLTPFALGLVMFVLLSSAIYSSIGQAGIQIGAQIQSDLEISSIVSQMGAEAASYYGKNHTYSTAGTCSSGMFADPSFVSIMSSVNDKNAFSCFAEGDTYAVSAELGPNGTTTSNFCVDSTGYSGNAVAIDYASTASCHVVGQPIGAAPMSQQASSTPVWNATLIGGPLSDSDKAAIVAGTVKLADVVASGDIASFRKDLGLFAPASQLPQLQAYTDAQLSSLMLALSPIASKALTAQSLYSSEATWTVVDPAHVTIKVQLGQNTAETINAVQEGGVWY